ncbi:MAG: hypothetical protein KAS32_24090 [Candidatus Peribacteraceae bacterium]|nr:hypothetical protein [Candidatus Peribacteraceae bacterium]
METIPEIGTHVRYHHKNEYHDRSCTGVVNGYYHGYMGYDEDTEEEFEVEPHICVRVHNIPDWWNWPDKNCFAPSMFDIEPI